MYATADFAPHPNGEIIARMAHQERQQLIAPFIFQFHRLKTRTARPEQLEANIGRSCKCLLRLA